MKKMIFVLIAGMAIFTSCDKNDDKKEPAAPVVITATGDITPKMNEFRVLLGEPLNITTGKTIGRREINWDQVPEEFITQNLPKTFFNPTDAAAPVARQRGFTYESDGEFRVSTNGFGNIELTLATQIQAFSGDRVFANISETLWDTQFQVAGSTEAATVNGFGAVFLDVDIANNSFLEFFNGNKKSWQIFRTCTRCHYSVFFCGSLV